MVVWEITTLFKSRGNKWKFYLKTILCKQSHFLRSNHNKQLGV